ncbi:histidinol dehydrogenase [Shimazuella kribbensis]|uniref:histidinol dehydrogenase n=1 Tax=Shimazuella kribbensis TaxID=139808 RepID=UPI0003FF7B31|nr:histidinol dehydrogenase [Shimazuella kribbensis]
MIKIVPSNQWQPRVNGTQDNKEILPIVQKIIAEVCEKQDAALFAYTKELDGAVLTSLLVAEDEKQSAMNQVESSFLEALQTAAERIRLFHEKERGTSWWNMEKDGSILGQLVRPMDRVGIYVPGGRAAYPSSVLMNAIPAIVAGVEDIVMVTPPDKNGQIPASTLVAAQVAGIERIYKVGGAQAIAALAYGTESIQRVDKIVGPGNQYVATAKQLVYGQVDIDSFAGPSEVVIIADEHANPAFVAADLLAQAEHDPEAAAVLLTSSEKLAKEVAEQVEKQTTKLERVKIIEESLHKHGAIVLTQDMDEAVTLSNLVAPEHLELMVGNPWELLPKVLHAGAVFLGPMSPETVGDYIAGPSHVLPTSGTARFSSALSVDTFIKKTSLISYSKEALKRDAKQVITLAEQEGLEAHAASIRIRMEED